MNGRDLACRTPYDKGTLFSQTGELLWLLTAQRRAVIMKWLTRIWELLDDETFRSKVSVVVDVVAVIIDFASLVISLHVLLRGL